MSNDMQTTPAPWRIAGNEIIGSGDIHVLGREYTALPGQGSISSRSFSPRVCVLNGSTQLPGVMANARLIAAAPAMLAALQQAQQTCKELHDWLSSGEDFDYDVLAEFAASTEQQAREAIALAMGGATQ